MNVLAMSGSLRTASYNRKILQIAKKHAVALGATVEELDLRELDLPMYDGDIEEKGMPESAVRLKRAIETADVILLATPEYNRSISGALKNAIDWASRGGNSWEGKVVAPMTASPGPFGGVRAMLHLREILSQEGARIVMKPEIMIGKVAEALTESGEFTDEKMDAKMKELVQNSITLAERK